MTPRLAIVSTTDIAEGFSSDGQSGCEAISGGFADTYSEPFETRHPRVRSAPMPEVPTGEQTCTHCDAVSPGGAVFCHSCGEPMTDVERWLEQAREFLGTEES